VGQLTEHHNLENFHFSREGVEGISVEDEVVRRPNRSLQNLDPACVSKKGKIKLTHAGGVQLFQTPLFIRDGPARQCGQGSDWEMKGQIIKLSRLPDAGSEGNHQIFQLSGFIKSNFVHNRTGGTTNPDAS